VVDLRCDPAVWIRTSLLAPVPESSRRQRVAVSQSVVPVPGAAWLGVLVGCGGTRAALDPGLMSGGQGTSSPDTQRRRICRRVTTMRQIVIKKQKRRTVSADLDLRTPAGRVLPY
jgi:hypothetical protein